MGDAAEAADWQLWEPPVKYIGGTCLCVRLLASHGFCPLSFAGNSQWDLKKKKKFTRFRNYYYRIKFHLTVMSFRVALAVGYEGGQWNQEPFEPALDRRVCRKHRTRNNEVLPQVLLGLHAPASKWSDK